MPAKPSLNLIKLLQHVIQRGDRRKPCFYVEDIILSIRNNCSLAPLFLKIIVLVCVLYLLPTNIIAAEYRLAMSKNDSLCKHVIKEYNHALREGSYVKHDSIPMFNKIKWKLIAKSYSLSRLASKYAFVDIDNNGDKEFVIKKHGMRQSILTQSLAIHEKEPEGARNEYTLKMFKESDGKLLSLPLEYKLNEFSEVPEPGSLDSRSSHQYGTSGMYASPMIFNNIVYISLEDPAERKLKKWVVIAKYKSGSLWGRKSDPQNMVLEDICYVEQMDNK